MANEKHLAKLKQGVATWNAWRRANPEVLPDLTDADLKGIQLSGADLRMVNFSGAILVVADLRNTKLINAIIKEAHLVGATLAYADLTAANLEGADLEGADLSGTKLAGANLRGAGLNKVNFSRADLRGTDFSHAKCNYTIFGDVDLSHAKGLDTIFHFGPSTIGTDTISRSKGNVSEVFLTEAGVSDSFLKASRGLLAQAIGTGVVQTGELNAVFRSSELVSQNVDINKFRELPSFNGVQALDRLGIAAKANIRALEQNMNQARHESRVFLIFTMFFAALGFIVVLCGLTLMYQGLTTEGGVTTAASVVSEVMAALFFRKDRELRESIRSYHKDVLESQAILTVVDIADSIGDSSSRDKAKTEIIKGMLGRMHPVGQA